MPNNLTVDQGSFWSELWKKKYIKRHVFKACCPGCGKDAYVPQCSNCGGTRFQKGMVMPLFLPGWGCSDCRIGWAYLTCEHCQCEIPAQRFKDAIEIEDQDERGDSGDERKFIFVNIFAMIMVFVVLGIANSGLRPYLGCLLIIGVIVGGCVGLGIGLLKMCDANKPWTER